MRSGRRLLRALVATATSLGLLLVGGAWLLDWSSNYARIRLEDVSAAQPMDRSSLNETLLSWSPPDFHAPVALAGSPSGVPGCQDATSVAVEAKAPPQRVIVFPCATAEDARYLAQLYLKGSENLAGRLPPALTDAEVDVKFIEGRALAREWIQGESAVFVISPCAPVTEACDASNAGLADSLARHLPGTPRTSGAQSALPSTIIGALLLYAFGVLIPGRIVTSIISRRDPRLHVGIPGVTDVSRDSMASLRGWLGSRRVAAATILTILGLLTLLGQFIVQYSLEGLLLGLAQAGWGLYWIIMAVRHRRLATRMKVRRRSRSVASRRAAIGLGMQDAAAFCMAAIVLAFIVHSLLGVMSRYIGPTALALATTNRVQSLPILSGYGLMALRNWLLTAQGGGSAVLLSLFAPGILITSLVSWIGRRLAAPSIKQALAQDDRPYFLMLRSFEEDKSRVRGYLNARTVIPNWLRPRTSRRFEEALVDRLALYGPVIAIAPPGSRLPALGAAKETLDNLSWQGRVDELLRAARAVVMLASPPSVNRGYAWEIQRVARVAQEIPVILVIGPHRWTDNLRRWAQFLGAAAGHPRFSALATVPLPPGTHVIACPATGGWRAYSSRSRHDVSYAVALDHALQGISLADSNTGGVLGSAEATHTPTPAPKSNHDPTVEPVGHR